MSSASGSPTIARLPSAPQQVRTQFVEERKLGFMLSVSLSEALARVAAAQADASVIGDERTVREKP